MEFPTLYEMEPIGVNGGLESTKALHFCSSSCLDSYRLEHPELTLDKGEEEKGDDLECCEQCWEHLP